MTAEHERRGAVEAIERILNRGGDADDVLRAVLQVLFQLYGFVGISFVEDGGLVEGPSVGAADAESKPATFPIVFQGAQVAELRVDSPGADDEPFLTRVATLVSPYALVGWDTGGTPWEP